MYIRSENVQNLCCTLYNLVGNHNHNHMIDIYIYIYVCQPSRSSAVLLIYLFIYTQQFSLTASCVIYVIDRPGSMPNWGKRGRGNNNNNNNKQAATF